MPISRCMGTIIFRLKSYRSTAMGWRGKWEVRNLRGTGGSGYGYIGTWREPLFGVIQDFAHFGGKVSHVVWFLDETVTAHFDNFGCFSVDAVAT